MGWLQGILLLSQAADGFFCFLSLLDFICKLENAVKENSDPKDIKFKVKDAICSNKVYEKRLQPEYDKCWTLEYAEVDGCSFNMDVVPAIDEDIADLLNRNISLYKPENSVAITNKHTEKDYSWCTINPKSYIEWFDSINKKFKEYKRADKLLEFFQENRTIFNSVEDIPEILERSSLQRVIQILKRHRDVYFSKSYKEDLKPASVVITTIVAQVADKAPENYSVYELLEYVVARLISLLQGNSIEGTEFALKHNGKWVLENSVNSSDNLVDSWNDNSDKPKYFLKWIEILRRDFLEDLSSPEEYGLLLENSFGSDTVRKFVDTSQYAVKVPSKIDSVPKPWGE